MDYRKTMDNEIFEAMMKKALIERYTEEVNALRNQEDDITFSEQFERKINRIAHLAGRKERIQGVCKFLIKLLVIAAAVMGVVFVGLLTQPKVYADVMEVIRNIFSTHDSYEYQSGSSNENPDFDSNITLQYIPQGYVKRYIFYSDYNVSMMYDNADGKEIKFSYGISDDSKISVDNERADFFEFERNGITYYYYQSADQSDFSTIIWYKDNYYFEIIAQLTKEEFVEIAENI